jgi:hypothetical protein
MVDCVGVDFAGIADQNHLNKATANLGQAPAFWGRYFKGPGNLMPVQYQAGQEENFFLTNKIPVLPLARQTPDVCKADKNLGYAAGLRNAAALVAAFGAVHLSQLKNGVVVFLDAEPATPLNSDYYSGWSSGLVDAGMKSVIDFRDEIAANIVPAGTTISFVPCVYGHHADDATWKALATAVGAGAACGAAWVVYEDLPPPQFPIGPWRPVYTNQYMPAQVPVVLCQRILDYGEGGFDFDLVNPASQNWLLQRLVLPGQLVG